MDTEIESLPHAQSKLFTMTCSLHVKIKPTELFRNDLKHIILCFLEIIHRVRDTYASTSDVLFVPSLSFQGNSLCVYLDLDSLRTTLVHHGQVVYSRATVTEVKRVKLHLEDQLILTDFWGDQVPMRSTLNSSHLDNMAAKLQTITLRAIWSLVKVRVWQRTGDKPVFEPMRIQFSNAYMQHWGKWVQILLNG